MEVITVAITPIPSRPPLKPPKRQYAPEPTYSIPMPKEHADSSCVEWKVIKQRKVLYECDQRACYDKENCNCTLCGHTEDITHAKNFRLQNGLWVEGKRDADEILP